MSFFHALWIPIAYKLFPNSVAYHGLRGFLKQQGVDPNIIPATAIREIANQTLELHWLIVKMSHMKIIDRLVDLTKSLELNALQVRALLFMENRSDSFLSGCWSQKEALERHRVAVPPVLVDRNNRPIG